MHWHQVTREKIGVCAYVMTVMWQEKVPAADSKWLEK